MCIRYLIWSLIFLFPSLVFPQVDKRASIELPIKNNEYPFYVLPAEEEGVVIYRQKNEDNADDYNHYEFYFYDQNLELIGNVLIKVEFMFEVVQHAYAKKYVYIVFSGVKNLKRRLFIYRFNIIDQTNETIEIDTFFPDVSTYFALFNNTIIIGGREKSKPSIVFYNPDDKRPVILQGFYEKNLDIHDVNIDEENELFTVLIGYSGKNRQKSLHVKSFDELGLPVEDIRIEPDNGVDFIHAKSIIINRKLRLISGIYRERRSLYATGIFMVTLHLDGSRESQFYPFVKLYQHNDRISQLVMSDNKTGISSGPSINPGKFQWQITDLSEYRNNNLVLLESFIAEKASSSFMDKNEDFYYQQALLILFDDSLAMKGIHQFKISPIVSDRLKQNVRIRYYNDSLKLYLFDQHQLAEKMIFPPMESKPVTYISIGIPDDDRRDDQGYHQPVSQIRHWYKDFFLLSGFRSVRDPENELIFFLQKLNYP